MEGTPAVDDGKLGRSLLWLLENPRAWIRRRIERFDLIDRRSIGRRVSLEFVLPEQIEGCSVGEVLTVIPVALLAKRPLRGFELRTEDGHRLSSLVTQESTTIARSVLLAAARRALSAEPDEAITSDLGAIVGNNHELTATALSRVLHEASDQGATAAVLEQREKLAEDREFRTITMNLASGFLLLTPRCAEAGDRRIWEFTHDDILEDPRPIAREIFAHLGLMPAKLTVPTPAAAWAASFHCEVDAPPDMEIVRARLDRAVRYVPQMGRVSLLTSPEGRRLRRATETMNRNLEARDGGGISRAHLHLPLPEQPVGADAAAVVEMRMKRNGFLRAAFLTCVLSASLFTAGYHRLPQLADNLEPAAALLLLIPGLLVAYLVRPGEHALASSLLLGARLMVLVAGLCSVVAVGLLVAKLDIGQLRDWWIGLRDLSTLTAVVVGLACILPTSGKRYASAP